MGGTQRSAVECRFAAITMFAAHHLYACTNSVTFFTVCNQWMSRKTLASSRLVSPLTSHASCEGTRITTLVDIIYKADPSLMHAAGCQIATASRTVTQIRKLLVAAICVVILPNATACDPTSCAPPVSVTQQQQPLCNPFQGQFWGEAV